MATTNKAADKPAADDQKTSGRKLAQAVYVTDDQGRTVVYGPGDVPAAEHRDLIGDHAYEPPAPTLHGHPHTAEVTEALNAQVGDFTRPRLAVMEATTPEGKGRQ